MDNLIAWRAWGEAAFDEARALKRPILLGISAVWCHWCHVMDRGEPGHPVHTGTYRDPEIAALINARFVPIRVDNDVRPDVNARYNQGGWPTTCFLTPDGQVIYGGTYFTPAQMRSLLVQIDRYWQQNGEALLAEAPDLAIVEKGSAGALDAGQVVADTLNAIALAYDPRNGGLGDGQKFPMTEAWETLLLGYHQTRDNRLLESVVHTLIAMGTQGMYDRTEGGWFRYSTTPDFSVPHFEKMLEDHARLLTLHAHALQTLDGHPGRAAQAATLRGVVEQALGYHIGTWLRERGGLTWFCGSQDADEAYYTLSRGERAERQAPFIDERLYVEWNAQMACALFALDEALDRPDLRALGQRVIDTLVRICLRADGAVLHGATLDAQGGWAPMALVGALRDQAALAQAMLQAGRPREAVLPLFDFAQGALSAEGGGFHDVPLDPAALGLLKARLRPIFENAAMAEALLLAGHLWGEPALVEEARAALAVFSEQYKRYGSHAGPFALAAYRAASEPDEFVVVGAPSETAPFLRAAGRRYHPWRMMRALDPAHPQDRAAIAARGFPLTRLPAAFFCRGTACSAPLYEPPSA